MQYKFDMTFWGNYLYPLLLNKAELSIREMLYDYTCGTITVDISRYGEDYFIQKSDIRKASEEYKVNQVCNAFGIKHRGE